MSDSPPKVACCERFPAEQINKLPKRQQPRAATRACSFSSGFITLTLDHFSGTAESVKGARESGVTEGGAPPLDPLFCDMAA